MRFLKSLKKTWQKASPGISNAQDDDTNSNIFHQQSESATPPGPSDPGNAQMNRQELIASTQSPGILTGAHGFIIDRPIMGENQQFQFHYHGTPPPSSREHLQISATPRTSISRGSSNQSHTTTPDGPISPEDAANNTFLGQNQNITIHNNKPESNVLKDLKEWTIRGAEYNSAERDPPPRCHPGTRTFIREQFQAHIDDPNLQTRIIWIHGPAGVGKSAIMQTVIEELLVSHRICATLFFSRPNQRDDAKKAFATLAYGLAVRNKAYREYIAIRMEDDPTCLAKSLDDQFRILFITPFLDYHVARDPKKPWVMFLDGLDECQNTKDSDNQCRIMKLICDSILNHAESIPFIWVIASRPEDNLKKTWTQIQGQFQTQFSHCWELDIPVDSDQATRDVELFLHHQFEKISNTYSDLIPGDTLWPSDSDFVKIANKSSGLFVFASTVTNYISDEDPVYRLNVVVSLINHVDQHSGGSSADENPFLMIDLLYSSIMADIPKRLLPILKSLLGFYHLQSVIIHPLASKREKMGLVDACNILGFQQNEAYAALRKLRSVIIYPSPKAAQREDIRFFHASFSDFLLDSFRSGVYHIDLNLELVGIWRSFARIMKESKTAQEYAGVNVSWVPGENPSNLRPGFQKELLRKSHLCWSQILIKSTLYRPQKRSPYISSLEVVMEVFEGLGSTFLLGDHFPVGDFMVWFDNHAPPVVRERIVSKDFALKELDTERLFRSLCTTRAYRYTTSGRNIVISLEAILKNLDTSQWAQAKEILLATPEGRLRALIEALDSDKVRVVIVGVVDPSESCAIVGPLPGEHQEFFYILPYAAI